MDELKASGKPFQIGKMEVWDAWLKVKGNQGAPGVDGQSIEAFEKDLKRNLYRVWNRMASGTYFPPPVMAVEIPKPHGGGTRVLGVPTVADRIAQTVAAARLEKAVEPLFHPDSYGYRPGRGALDAVAACRKRCWEYNWVIDLDIRKFFDSVRWDLLVKAVEHHTGHETRWAVLYVRRWLAAPLQLPDGTLQERDRGTPQGSVASPILSSIYLHKLDEFVERELIPQYTRGARRKTNPEYKRTENRLAKARQRGDRAAARDLEKQLRTLPSVDPADPGYRRLRYLRYADDHLLRFTGPKAEAGEIKTRLARFLRETLGLELNQRKTLITHARSQPARFLGYHITVQHNDTARTAGRRSANGNIALRVPPDVIKAQCARYREHGKPWHRSRLQNLDDYDIVRIYGAEYRGVVNYYLLARDVWRLHTLHWHALTSMLKTLAAKHHGTVTQMAARHRATITTSDGPRACYEARRHREGREDLVARFGGIILRQDRRAVIRDPAPGPEPYPRKELTRRLRRRECELCETGTTVAVHQVAGLKALGEPGPGQPAWAALMAKMRRKTLIVCTACHDWIHANPVTHAA